MHATLKDDRFDAPRDLSTANHPRAEFGKCSTWNNWSRGGTWAALRSVFGRAKARPLLLLAPMLLFVAAAAAAGPTTAPSALAELVGRPLADPRVRALLDALEQRGTPVRPEQWDLPKGVAAEEKPVHLFSRDGGIDLVVDARDTVQTIILYDAAKGVDGRGDIARYAGRLPSGLSFDDGRDGAVAKIGPPVTSSGSDGFATPDGLIPPRYDAEYPHLGLSLRYVGDWRTDPHVRINNVVVTAPQPRPDAKADKTPPRLRFQLVAKAGDADAVRVPMLRPNRRDGDALTLERRVFLDESDVANVYPSVGPSGERAGGLTMTPRGADRLRTLTRENVGRQLAVVLDGRVLVAPMIQDAIGENVMLSFGPQPDPAEVADVVGRLHAAAHPLPTTRPAE